MSGIPLGMGSRTSLCYDAFDGNFLGDFGVCIDGGHSLGLGRCTAGDSLSARMRLFALYVRGAHLWAAPTLSAA